MTSPTCTESRKGEYSSIDDINTLRNDKSVEYPRPVDCIPLLMSTVNVLEGGAVEGLEVGAVEEGGEDDLLFWLFFLLENKSPYNDVRIRID
jgi:hypothetical protein